MREGWATRPPAALLVSFASALPALLVAADLVRVHASGLGEGKRQKLEANDVHDRVPGRDELDVAAQLAQGGKSVAGPIGGAASPSRTKHRTDPSTAARYPCRSCSV
jgi:hypothetical protein